MSEIASGAAGAWSYRAGAWFAVFGSKVTVLLPESQRAQVVSLWALIDGGAGFDEVLDGLLASGLSKLPGFVLVSTDGGPTRVLLRGEGVTATLTADGEDVTLDGAAGHTWVERSVEGVSALTVRVPEEDEVSSDVVDLPILTGLVRVSRVDRPAAQPPAPAAPEQPEDLGQPEHLGQPGQPERPAAADQGVGSGALGGAMAGGAFLAGAPDSTDPADQADPVAADPVMVEADPGAPDEPGEPAGPGEPDDVEGLEGSDAVAVEEPSPLEEPGALDEPSPFDEPSPLDEPSPFGGPSASGDAGEDDQATQAMPSISGDPLTDPLPELEDPPAGLDEDQPADDQPVDDQPLEHPAAEAPAPEPAPAQGPDDWVTPWDSAPAGGDAALPQTDEQPMDEQPMDDQPDEQPGDEPGAPDPMAEHDTPSFPPPAFPAADGATEVAPAGWVPPPPPVEPGVNDAPPLTVGSWEPVGGNYPPPPPADPDHDGLTVAGGGEQSAPPAPGIPGQPPAPAVTAPVAKLMVSDGQTVLVDRAILIGRAPEARRFTSTEQPMLVSVPSRLHEISSTHVEVRPGTGADHGSAVVTDMGSTNGTVLVQPGLGPEDLKPGIAVQLIPGAIINLGDGITIQVTRP